MDTVGNIPLGLMPQATLAAVVIVYSVGLIEPAKFRAILRVNPEARQMVERSPLWETLGPDRLFLNMETAVQHYSAQLHPGGSPALADR